jgi:hypothetical protein
LFDQKHELYLLLDLEPIRKGLYIMNRVSKLTGSLAACVLALSACGGEGQASIGGSVTGLGAGESVVLQNNDADMVTVTSDKTFYFPALLGAGAAYKVVVVTQPAGKSCNVSNGTGVVNSHGDTVTDVLVSCASTSSVGGTVTGLGFGLSLTLLDTYPAGAQTLIVSTNGAFVFPGLVPLPDNAFSVSVQAQPSGQTCTINGGTVGTGTTAVNVMAAVTVVCQ